MTRIQPTRRSALRACAASTHPYPAPTSTTMRTPTIVHPETPRISRSCDMTIPPGDIKVISHWYRRIKPGSGFACRGVEGGGGGPEGPGGWRLEAGGWRLVFGRLVAFLSRTFRGLRQIHLKARSEMLQAVPRPTSSLQPPTSAAAPYW